MIKVLILNRKKIKKLIFLNKMKIKGFGKEYCGLFHFRFWQKGVWIDVVIDELAIFEYKLNFKIIKIFSIVAIYPWMQVIS